MTLPVHLQRSQMRRHRPARSSPSVYAERNAVRANPTDTALRAQVHHCRETLREVQTDLASLVNLREDAVTCASDGCHDPGAVLAARARVSSLVSQISARLLALAEPLQALKPDYERLVEASERGDLAVTKTEVEQLGEQIEVARALVKQNTETIKEQLLTEHADREARHGRLAVQVQADHPHLTDAVVAGTITQADASAKADRLEHLDLQSYGGRLACESPFHELARLVDTLMGTDTLTRSVSQATSAATLGSHLAPVSLPVALLRQSCRAEHKHCSHRRRLLAAAASSHDTA